MTIKYRQLIKYKISTKPAIVGWTPSGKKLDLIIEGRGKELPGYRLYKLQTKYYGTKFGKLCGFLFGKFYADKPVKT
jgi:hypothetical protein